jgi:tetratricopeptide (TPR) repeat protein
VRSTVRRNLILALLAAAAFAAPAHAQRDAAPRRPPLGAAADTNSAPAFMDLGARSLEGNPRQAADAFYWAYQLDPTSADALYGRYVATLLATPRRVIDYFEGNRRTMQSREILAVDSLYFRALTMDPFLFRRFETQLIRGWLMASIRADVAGSRGGHNLPDSEISSYVDQYIRRLGSYVQAQRAYGEGRFQEAADLYQRAIGSARVKSRVRAERGRLMAHIGNNSEAMSELSLALADMRREDERDLVYVYDDKALMEHSIASLHERMGNGEAAREAYGRALTEDLAFYPAHVRLGLIALAAGDTTAAVAELDLAAQTSTEPSVHYTYGAVLAQLGRLDEAAAQLARASEAAPHWAEPYFVLGVVRDGQGDMAAARAAYEGFLARAVRNHRRRSAAEGRVRDLQAQGSEAAAPAGSR